MITIRRRKDQLQIYKERKKHDKARIYIYLYMKAKNLLKS